MKKTHPHLTVLSRSILSNYDLLRFPPSPILKRVDFHYNTPILTTNLIGCLYTSGIPAAVQHTIPGRVPIVGNPAGGNENILTIKWIDSDVVDNGLILLSKNFRADNRPGSMVH